MNIEAQKMRLNTIDNSFSELKKNIRSEKPCREIEKVLSELYHPYKFYIRVINSRSQNPCFVMSVFPESATVDQIIASILKEESTNVIHQLWKQNKFWVIEIDRRVLDDTYINTTERECTALLLHEVGHVVSSGTIPSRISRVMKYEMTKIRSDIKAVFKMNRFTDLLSLPIMDSCSFSNNLKEEIEADSFAKNCGYGNELTSIMNKFIDNYQIDPDKSMQKVLLTSAEIVDNFRKRRANVNKKWFSDIISRTPSEYIKERMSKQRSEFTESPNPDASDERHMNYVCESVNRIMDNYYAEFFITKKKLKKLPEYDIDYIEVEIDKIKSHDDKLLILSYIRNKMDTCQYYIDILNSDKYAKKYEVPHSMEYLTAYYGKLNKLVTKAMAKKIEPKTYIQKHPYPVGYEG